MTMFQKIFIGMFGCLSFVIVIGVLSVMIGKGVTPSDEQTPQTTQSTESSDLILPQSYKDSFLSACITESGLTEYCNCSLDFFENNYPTERILAISARMEVDNTYYPEELMKAVENCAYLLVE